MKHSEDSIQKSFFQICELYISHIPEFALFFHVPNGGKRNAIEASKFKLMGVKSGVPDVLLPIARKGYNGLAIEFKYGKNKTTDNQNFWINSLRKENWYVIIAYTWEEALACSMLYCNFTSHECVLLHKEKYRELWET